MKKILLIIVPLIGLLAAGTYLFPSNNADDNFQRGMDYYDQGNFTKAVKYLKKAAVQGHIKAQNNLGFMYHEGEGVEQNLTEAANWYRKSAEQNNVDAQINLAAMYKKGEGVEKNITQAIYWFRKAAEQGDEHAKDALEELEPSKEE
jgi:TPR repeat protein